MIYDKLDNLETYRGISDDISLGLEWLRNVNPEIEDGVYELSPNVKVIVSRYTTKYDNEYGYEAHRQFIDIQYLFNGIEKICYMPLGYLNETKAYSEEMDAAFLEETNIPPQELFLGNGYFAIFFPQDGHKPQLCIGGPETVKKAVVKVKSQ